MKYYIAYGSNLNIQQMGMRCPFAQPFGTSEIKDYQLLYRGSKTGSYLTIEPCEGKTVPVVIWGVTKEDEKALDRYEGFPIFYYKQDFDLQVKSFTTKRMRKIKAFAYIMHEDRPLGLPANYYVYAVAKGYESFNISKQALYDAYKDTKEKIDAKNKAC